MSLSQKFFTEYLIAFLIRSIVKFTQHREMRRSHTDGFLRFSAIFQHHEIAEPRCLLSAEHAFPIGGPDIQGCAHGLLSAVVKVIAERRSYLTFEFNGNDKFVFVNY